MGCVRKLQDKRSTSKWLTKPGWWSEYTCPFCCRSRNEYMGNMKAEPIVHKYCNKKEREERFLCFFAIFAKDKLRHQ